MNRAEKRKKAKAVHHNVFTKRYKDPEQRDKAMQNLFGERWINFKRLLRSQKKKIKAARLERRKLREQKGV